MSRRVRPWIGLGALPVIGLVIVIALFPTEDADAAGVTVLSGNQSLASTLVVAAGDVLRFDPSVNTVVEIAGNLVVEGTLEMKPAAGISHTLRFIGVNEASFVGGGMSVLESDRGLWVTGAGRLDILGTPRAGWNRTGTDPTWKSGDELRVAPVAIGDYGESGFATFTAGASVPRADPTLPPAEVMNLTRNVHIEGTPGGRSHVTILSTVPQSIRYAAFRYMGPRQSVARGTSGVTGRYPIHFHHNGEGSRGSVVEGNVIRESGSRAIVIHWSNGVLVKDNVAYDVFDAAYWWDPEETDASNDVVLEHNLAAYIRVDTPGEHTNSGFELNWGNGNVANNNAAVGVQGQTNCSGFQWPSSGSGLWTFDGNVAHNNHCHGIFVWQNDNAPHVINNFISYRNRLAGISHGAYENSYQYSNLYLFQNQGSGVELHPFSEEKAGFLRQTWTCVQVVGSPLALSVQHSAASGIAVVFDHVIVSDVGALVQVSEGALEDGQDLLARVQFDWINFPCGSTTPLNGDPFKDDQGSVHENDIEALSRAQVTLGCGPSSFCPGSSVTRGQMAAFLVRGLGLPPTTEEHFTDDNGSLFQTDINRLAKWGITGGCGPGAFCPDAPVTREQMAAFLVRALELPASSTDFFADDEGSPFEADINAVAQAGITKGCSTTSFCSSQNVTRAQMASFLVRALGLE